MSQNGVVRVPLPKDIQAVLSDIDSLRLTEGVVGDALATFQKELAEEASVYEALSSLDPAEMTKLKSSIVAHLESAEGRVQDMCTDLDAMHTALSDIIGKNNTLLRETAELGNYLDGLERYDLAESKRRIVDKIKNIQTLLVDENRVGENSVVHYYDPGLADDVGPAQEILHVKIGSVDGNSITLFEDANTSLFTSRVFDRRATLLKDTDLHKRPDNTAQWRVAYVSKTGLDFEKKHKMTGLYNLEVHRPSGFVKLSIYGMLDVVEPGDDLFICLAIDDVTSFDVPVVKLF